MNFKICHGYETQLNFEFMLSLLMLIMGIIVYNWNDEEECSSKKPLLDISMAEPRYETIIEQTNEF